MDDFAFTQEELATRVGRARSTVANTLRLLELNSAVQDAVVSGAITEGHARAIGGLPTETQAHVVSAVIEDDLSVRQTEELVRRLREPRPIATEAAVKPAADPDVERVEEDLRRSLGTKVRLTRTRRGGRITIEYYGDEELARLYQRLTGGAA